MNKETFEGNWNELKGKIKEKWGKLTDDDLTQIRGKRDQLLGKLQQRYGYAKEQADKEIVQWEQESSRAFASNQKNPNQQQQQKNQKQQRPPKATSNR